MPSCIKSFAQFFKIDVSVVFLVLARVNETKTPEKSDVLKTFIFTCFCFFTPSFFRFLLL